jgi:hypothetical protein
MYRVMVGVADASVAGSTITIDTGLTNAIPAAVTAINLASHGYWNFNGLIVRYNYGYASSGVYGVFWQLAAAPDFVTTFKGAVIRNVGPTPGASQSTPAIYPVGGVRNEDISGVTINDQIVTTWATSTTTAPSRSTYQPTGFVLEGMTETIWRLSTPSLYLNARGEMTSDGAAPTFGTITGAYATNRQVSAGAPNGWDCRTGSWLPRSYQTGASSASTNMSSATDAINTTFKYLGKEVWDTTSKKPLYASGTATTSPWVDATGTTVYTPA